MPEEAEVLQAKAEEANMSKARFLKNVILQGGAYEKTNFTAEDVGKLQYEIDKIGNNINQIAVRANGSSNIDEIEFFKLRDNYMELLSAFYDFIHGKGDVN
ncbi:mobilization protein [human gut metagenome]|uniref:Mobilization protein n=1 Tax=human gut metagenome TaxID=408170 RepID=K1THD1_9ZZZZ